MRVVYNIDDGTLTRSRKRIPPLDPVVLETASAQDVADIGFRMNGDEIRVLFCDKAGRVIFEINRDELYPPLKKPGSKIYVALNRFHADLRNYFLAPIATDKVFSTVDMEQLAPKTGAEPVAESAIKPVSLIEGTDFWQ